MDEKNEQYDQDESISSEESKIQEEKEDIKEEAVLKGKMPLNKHYIHKGVCKKKYWYWKSSSQYCPMNKWFSLSKAGEYEIPMLYV